MQVGTFDDLPNNIFSAVKTPEIFKINREKNKNFMLRAMARYSIFRDNFEVYEQYKIVFFCGKLSANSLLANKKLPLTMESYPQ